MLDDEVGAHTRVTVLAYWKFESVSLEQRVMRTRDLKADRGLLPFGSKRGKVERGSNLRHWARKLVKSQPRRAGAPRHDYQGWRVRRHPNPGPADAPPPVVEIAVSLVQNTAAAKI
jgi:hypothetical protein